MITLSFKLAIGNPVNWKKWGKKIIMNSIQCRQALTLADIIDTNVTTICFLERLLLLKQKHPGCGGIFLKLEK